MKRSDSLKRAIAFYVSVIAFATLLPILLSYALGYKINYKTLRIYKTGIIYVNSYPAGAWVYLNGELQPTLTPARLEELRPGPYRVEIGRDGFYPWSRELIVRGNMVTKADRIVLFPIDKEMKRISRHPVTDFAVADNGDIYYMSDYGLFESDSSGGSIKPIASYSKWPRDIKARKFSQDGTRLLYFGEKVLYVAYLKGYGAAADKDREAKVKEVFVSEEPIVDVFWYSRPDYVVVVTEKEAKIVELRGVEKRSVVSFHVFDKKPGHVYYDQATDSLYFIDTGRGSLKKGGYLYRLDLRQTYLERLKQILLGREETSGGGK